MGAKSGRTLELAWSRDEGATLKKVAYRGLLGEDDPGAGMRP